MEIRYRRQFTRHLNERIKPFSNLVREFKDSLLLFTLSPDDPALHDHQLEGDKAHLRAFSVTDDIRVIYYHGKDYIYFIDIGSHTQVY